MRAAGRCMPSPASRPGAGAPAEPSDRRPGLSGDHLRAASEARAAAGLAREAAHRLSSESHRGAAGQDHRRKLARIAADSNVTAKAGATGYQQRVRDNGS
jgi:hypothetical protein